MKNKNKIFGFALITAIALTIAACWQPTDDLHGLRSVSVTGVMLNRTSAVLSVGESEVLTATVSPPDASNKDVSWSSDNTGIATVNNGIVTAVAEGQATITVTTADGGITASCIITVIDDSTQGGAISAVSLAINARSYMVA